MLRSIPFLLASLGTPGDPALRPAAEAVDIVDISELVSTPAAPPESAATLLQVRWGKTASGATRVVFQLDRTVDYLTVELPGENGLEVRLLGAGLGAPRDPMTADGRLVRDVVVRAGTEADLVARIRSAGPRLRARTFTLTSPPRVVIDLKEVSSDLSTNKGQTPVQLTSTPAPAKKTLPEAEVAAAAQPPATDETRPVESPGPTEGGELAFDDLLDWIHGVKIQADAIDASETEEDQNVHRRTLAYLLADRGIFDEAIRSLTAALSSEFRDTTTVFGDSLFLAEVCLRAGDHERASEIARALDVRRADAPQKARTAEILSHSGFPALAAELLEGALPSLTGGDRARAELLLARCHWDQRAPEEARQITRRLLASAAAPGSVRSSATVLHADCLWAAGETREAGKFYREASKLKLTPHEASWASLQLGNLARREGRIDEARKYYRRTVEQWPDSFYATQADWFLHVADETNRLREAGARRNRG